MDTFFNILRKGLVLTMMVMFAFVFTYVPQPFSRIQTAEAIPVSCVGGTCIPTMISSATSAVANSINTAKEVGLDGIGFAIAKAIISSLIGSLITWINSGFQGKPAFVQDVKRFLLDAADRAAGEFIRKLGGIGSFICSPFKLDIQVALAIQYQQAREHDEPEECRLSQIVTNLEDFYKGTFSNSSLADFVAITSSPTKYTPYGQLLTAKSNMRIRLANAKGEVLTEADWGGGFLSGKICKMIEKSTGPEKSCTISKPGQVIAGSLNKALGAGQDQLVAADEINELISALIGQLANQAIIGAAGLLGLSAGTGHTTPGFDGGSYISAATNQANGMVGSTTAAAGFSADTFSDAITVQENAVTAANNAIPALLAYSNNPRMDAEKRAMARQLYEDAVSVRNKALADTTKITTLLNEFTALENELKQEGITTERTQAIAQRKTQLYTAFLSINAITETALASSIRSWKPPV